MDIETKTTYEQLQLWQVVHCCDSCALKASGGEVSSIHEGQGIVLENVTQRELRVSTVWYWRMVIDPKDCMALKSHEDCKEAATAGVGDGDRIEMVVELKEAL